MPIQTEFLNRGLVTARNSALLEAGEVSIADECEYRPYSQSLFKATGRSAYGTVSAGNAVKGGRHLSFIGNNPDILLAYLGANLYAATFDSTHFVTGTFAQLPQAGAFANSGTPDETLETIFYNNAHMILAGTAASTQAAGRPRIINYLSPVYVQVANCTTTSGSAVVTCASNGFADVQPGQQISGTNIPANTVVLTRDSTTQVTMSANATGSSSTVLVTFSNAAVLTTRYAGLQPVVAFGNNAASAAAILAGTLSGVTTTTGIWPSTSDTGNGYYYFLYTELILNGSDELVESTSSVDPQYLPVIQITNTSTQCAFICFELPVNDGTNGTNKATHFQVYMSDRQTDAKPAPSLASFKRVGSPIAITTYVAKMTYTLTETTVPVQGYNYGTSKAVNGTAPEWTNPNNLYSATLKASAIGATPPPSNLVRDFGLSTTGSYATATVLGVEVALTAGALPGGTFYVSIRRRDLSKVAAARSVGVAVANGNYTLGGPTDNWGVGWVSTDFADTAAGFEVVVTDSVGSGLIFVGGIRVKVYYSGTSINRNGKPFPVITLSSQVGISVSTGANYPPPAASTGDVFDGQVVLNDISQNNVVRYSIPGQGEYFPAVYQLKFEGLHKDKVTCIKRINRALVIGFENALRRANYLPRESDPSFESGRAIEDIAVDHGIPGPQAATLFTIPGRGPYLAYVSQNGMHMTDGITTITLNDDLDWVNTVALDYLKYAIVVDYPALYQLRLYYTPTGQTTNTKAIYFHYHPSHLKGGLQMPATGPITVSARSAFQAWASGTSKVFTGHNTDGKIYLEDRAADANQYVDDSGGSPAVHVRTRRIYPNGYGGEARQERLWFLTGQDGNVTTGLVTIFARPQNIGQAAFNGSSITFDTSVGGLQVVHSDEHGESFSIDISKTYAASAGLRLESFSYYVDSPTMESNRK